MRLIDADALIDWIDENVSANTPYALVTKAVVISALKSKNVTPTVGGWISVKDGLPDEKQSEITHDFGYVLCATTFGDVRAYKFGTPIGWKEPHFWNGCGNMDEYVTHWMPLPEPPKEEGIT